ncbi:hypothetical protein GCM10028895_39880 [Pontibacter rugosus]
MDSVEKQVNEKDLKKFCNFMQPRAVALVFSAENERGKEVRKNDVA